MSAVLLGVPLALRIFLLWICNLRLEYRNVRVLNAILALIVALFGRPRLFRGSSVPSSRRFLSRSGCKASFTLFTSSMVMTLKRHWFLAILLSAFCVFLDPQFSFLSTEVDLFSSRSSSYRVLLSAHKSSSVWQSLLKSAGVLNMSRASLCLVFLFFLDKGLEMTAASSPSSILCSSSAISRCLLS